jgi:hypothetical protein
MWEYKYRVTVLSYKWERLMSLSLSFRPIPYTVTNRLKIVVGLLLAAVIYAMLEFRQYTIE